MQISNQDTPILTVIFSRDRAMQLDATLQSLIRHCQDIRSSKITVLYKTTDENHSCQYQELEKRYPQVEFYRENSFRENLFEVFFKALSLEGLHKIYLQIVLFFGRLVSFCAGKMPLPGHVLFIVDDTIFVRDWEIKKICQLLDRHQDVLGFSLRLGLNTKYCYTLKCPQRTPEYVELGADVIKFNWVGSDADFCYPLELSSSIYRIADILPLLGKIKFKNPNQLEGQMAITAKRYAKRQSFLLSFLQSAAFSVPVNKVQDANANHAGLIFSYASAELAKMFGEGLRINITALDSFTPNACHQEVEFLFERR